MTVSPRVLIVDDKPDSATTLAMLLATYGVATQSVTDARLALDAFAEFHPHVVILDLGLPFLNGYELCQRIRAFPASQAVLVVIISGYEGPDHKYKTLEARANYYILKPTDRERLIELVKAAGQ